MMMMSRSNSSRLSSGGVFIRSCVLGFVMTSTILLFGPALYWKINKGSILGYHPPTSCLPCICDCPPPLSILKIAPGLVNLSTEDCGKGDPEVQNEMEKQYGELVIEELKLQEIVGEEQIRHMNATYREARRVASQYQREAEKCTFAIETCEHAREIAEALIRKEIRLASLWEQRALQMGWDNNSDRVTI